MLTEEEKETFKEALNWGIGTIENMLGVNYFPLMTAMEIDEQQAKYLDIIKTILKFMKNWSFENEHQTNGN